MNKIVVGLLVAVCLLGFALILLNERMGTEIAAPVVSENASPRPPQETPLSVEPPSSEKTSELGEEALENSSKAVPDIVEKVQEVVPNTNINSEIVNKALDEVLSERAADVQAPNQQASIVQQTSVTDLVVESSQIPKIASDMPTVTVPQPVEISTPQTSTDINDKVTKPSTGAVVLAKEEKVPSAEDGKSSISKVAVAPLKNESNTKGPVVKSTAEEKNDNAKASATAKAKAFAVTIFTVFTRENGATVRLRTNATLPYSTAQLQNPKAIVKELQNPARLMFDLTGTWEIKEPAVPNNIIVNKVRVGKMADRARIVVDLKDKPKKMRVKIADKKDGLDIFLDR